MKRITEFLAKFKNLKPPQEAIEDEVRRIIKEKIKTPDDSYEVVFKKPNLTITSLNPALKNEVFIQKENIINQLKGKFRHKTEIRIFFK